MIYSMTQLKQISRIKQKLKNNLFTNSKIFSKLLLNVRLNTVQKYSVGVVNENKRQQDQYLTLRLLIENHFSTEYAKLHIHVFAQFFFLTTFRYKWAHYYIENGLIMNHTLVSKMDYSLEFEL
jgi:hypothetical protein